MAILLSVTGPLTEPAFWVLTALVEQPRHGYAVLRRAEELGAQDLKVTTLYATLERLAGWGLARVLSEEVVDGRARRTYAVTDEGRELLVAEADRAATRAEAARRSLSGTHPDADPDTAPEPSAQVAGA